MFIQYLAAGLLALLLAVPDGMAARLPVVEFNEGWEYRWGDSPFDENGIPVWTYEFAPDTEWHDLVQLEDTPIPERENFVWIRVRLPDARIANAAVFTGHIYMSVEAYLDGRQIYNYGKLERDLSNKYALGNWHIIPLPEDYHGKMLYLRVYSNYVQGVGMVMEHDMLFGPYDDVQMAALTDTLEWFLLGFLFFIIGILSLVLYLLRRRENLLYLLSFSIFTISFGLFYIHGSHISQLIFPSGALSYYLLQIATYTFSIGLYSFCEVFMGQGYKASIRRTWQFFLIYFGIVLQMDLILNIPMYAYTNVYWGANAIALLIILVTGLVKAYRGGFELRVMTAGMVILVLGGLNDIFNALRIITTHMSMSAWGLFIFILCIAYLIERRFRQTHEDLKIYSNELELSHNKLEEYSTNLEQMVMDRTQDLHQKNSKLKATLQELKDAQNQLVMQEKMASLGNLVAGVAHEINTPVGAVNSSANVTGRAAKRIADFLQGAKSIEELLNNNQFQQTLKILMDNNQVIETAGERIAKIVRSLRTFARLDEAEVQEADIHEGIDSTLTLLQHETKNRISIEKEYSRLPKIYCYPSQLNQVFMNVLMNGIQAIEGKGTITISTSHDAHNVHIRISDTGKGIIKGHIPKIFDPGFTSKGVGVGTGLGLSISYNIIKKHKGTIDVESVEGKGTSFTITLPIKDNENPSM